MMVLTIMMKKVASKPKHTQFKTRVQKRYSISDRNRKNMPAVDSKKSVPVARSVLTTPLAGTIPPHAST